MKVAGGGAWALAIVPLLLAGCADPFAAAIDCASYLEENEGREGSLVVLVTDEPGGPALDGVRVRVEGWGACWQRNEDGETSGGRVSWTLPAWGHASVSVEIDGWTPERVEGIPLALEGRTVEQTIPVYRERLQWSMTRSFAGEPPGVLPVVGGDPGWDAHEIPWNSSRETAEGYAARIVRMDVALAWTNARTAFADLDLGLGRSQGQADIIIASGSDQSGEGDQREAGTITAEAMYRAGWSEATGILVGALSQKPHATITGPISYEITIDATFGPPRDANTPAGAWIGVVALAAAALALRRRPAR